MANIAVRLRFMFNFNLDALSMFNWCISISKLMSKLDQGHNLATFLENHIKHLLGISHQYSTCFFFKKKGIQGILFLHKERYFLAVTTSLVTRTNSLIFVAVWCIFCVHVLEGEWNHLLGRQHFLFEYRLPAESGVPFLVEKWALLKQAFNF